MSKFSRLPPPPKTAAEFVAQAEIPPATDDVSALRPVVPASLPPRPARPPSAPPSKPWEAYKKKAAPRRVFNIRLNDYYWELLHYVGAKTRELDEETSLQKLVRDILLPELERRAGIIEEKPPASS